MGRHLGAGAPDGDIIARSIVCCRNGKMFEMSPPSQPTPHKPKTEIVGLKNAVILIIAIGNVWSDETVSPAGQFSFVGSWWIPTRMGHRSRIAHSVDVCDERNLWYDSRWSIVAFGKVFENSC